MIKKFDNFKINESGKLTFDNVMNTEWVKTFPYDADGAGAKIGDSEVIFVYSEIWDEWKPLAQSLIF